MLFEGSIQFFVRLATLVLLLAYGLDFLFCAVSLFRSVKINVTIEFAFIVCTLHIVHRYQFYL